MTIKSNGGVFGRHPSYESVDANSANIGNLNVSGTTSLNGAVVINESGANVDFRVEGDTLVNLLFADASADAVGVGTNAPSSIFEVAKVAAAAIPAAGAASSHVEIGTGLYGTLIGSRSDGLGYIQQQRTDGIAATYNLTLNPNGGNVGIGVAVPTAKLSVAGGNISVDSGYGIDFSATPGTGTSELFDDYEEGTWTPGFSTGTGEAYTYASRGGRYVKTGEYVFCSGFMELSAYTAGTRTHAWLTGLPFGLNTNAATAPAGSFSYGTFYDKTTLFTVADVSGITPISDGSTSIYLLRAAQSGTSTIFVRPVEIQVGYVMFSFSYRAV
jgi:hypothetical protein